jgi:hypothetical protein
LSQMMIVAIPDKSTFYSTQESQREIKI